MGGLNSLFNTSSSTANNTETTDASVVGGNNSVNTSSRQQISGNNNHVTTTDHGAVAGGLNLAMRGIEGVEKLLTQQQAAQGDLMAGVLNVVGQQSNRHAADLQTIKTGDTRTLFLGALALAGVLGVMALRRG